MSQMFLPFFSLTFLLGIAKTPITPTYLKTDRRIM